MHHNAMWPFSQRPCRAASVLALGGIECINPSLHLINLGSDDLLHILIDRAVSDKQIVAVAGSRDKVDRRTGAGLERAAGTELARHGG